MASTAAVKGRESVAFAGKLKLIAVIEKILKHIGLNPQPPPRAKARRVDFFEAVEAA